jgi:penicillin amidase
MKKLLVLAIALVGTAAALVAGAIAFARRFLPRTEGSLQVPGLHGPVEILRDRWGTPHIYAQTEEDLFFAQGYIHAQDRLWQMELQRRLGAGRLAEVLGEAALPIDRTFRILGLNRAAAAEIAALDPSVHSVLSAYAAGVNACMERRRGRLSLEFALLRYQPEPWQPLDSLLWGKVMSFNLGANWGTELIRLRLAHKVGADLAADLEPPYPADNPVTVTTARRRGRRKAGPPNGWGSDALRDALRQAVDLLGIPHAGGLPGGLLPGVPLGGGASNQWAVRGERSVTGHPLLANDTHLPVSMPGVFYQAHLVGGRYDVTGVSFPGIPGIIIGHNAHCAWGLTTAWQDAQDLYAERFNPADPRQYEVEGQWVEAQVISETIHVKGWAQPVIVEVTVTRHGPVVSQLLGIDLSLALRWVALDPTNLIDSALAYNRATSWEEFRQALSMWETPAHNFVYADRGGNIAFLQAGRVPVRGRGYGMVPVPGWTSDDEWQRFLTLDELPQAVNPEQGWIAVANNLVVDEAYPHFLSSDLENPSRAVRVAELLAGPASLAPEDFARFQLDTTSALAQRFVHYLVGLQPTNTREAAALELLKAWDYRMEPESVAAAIYQVTRLQAEHVVFDGALGELAAAYIGVDSSPVRQTTPYLGRSIVRLLNMLDDPGDNTWLVDPTTGVPRTRAEVVHRALRQALKLMKEELGEDMDRWTWGRLNQVLFSHPLGAQKPLHLLFNRGPYPMGGDHDTLLRAVTKPQFPFPPVAVAASMRFVADLSDWDRCRMIVPGGQSGHVASPHYADLIPLWRDGELLAMPYSREAVLREARKRLVLETR